MVRDRSQTPKLRSRLPPVTSTYLRGMQLSSSHPAAAVLAAVLAEQGVRHAVVSPGSRNAPLVLALHEQPEIDVRVSIDERAAAHHALGIALATWTPVPVVCTSGTAALNHGPALAEAFHARIPLLSITADRPVEVIGRGHGQSLTQAGLHALHTLHHDVLDESVMDREELTKRTRHALYKAMFGGPGQASGPVHLNVPFDEPLYELASAPVIPCDFLEQKPEMLSTPHNTEEKLFDAISRGKALVLAGPRPATAHRVAEARRQVHLPCLAERGSCVSGPLVVYGGERLLEGGKWPSSVQPEAIITLGLPPMSKAIRTALADLPHWHVGADMDGEGSGWDIWGTLQGDMPQSVLQMSTPAGAAQNWKNVRDHLDQTHQKQKPAWSDLGAWKVMTETWSGWERETRPRSIHVANSASARYAQWVDLDAAMAPHAVFHANRGVAGIDGCTSTAIGWESVQPTKQGHWLVTGDVAFHYDANALLTDPVYTNLNVIVINNGGGGIFRWLPGTQHPHLFKRHFETPPSRTVKAQAQAMEATYFLASCAKDLRLSLNQAADTDGPTVIDVQTPAERSAEVLTQYLNAFRKT